MNIEISDLVIEVTRRCNFNCDHCLRGSTQRKDMDISICEKLVSELQLRRKIFALTLSGGEPFLKPQLMRNIIFEINPENICCN